MLEVYNNLIITNSLGTCVTCTPLHKKTWSSLVKVMRLCRIADMELSGPIMIYWQSGTYEKMSFRGNAFEKSVKCQLFCWNNITILNFVIATELTLDIVFSQTAHIDRDPSIQVFCFTFQWCFIFWMYRCELFYDFAFQSSFIHIQLTFAHIQMEGLTWPPKHKRLLSYNGTQSCSP